jgi:xanthine/uracil permease
MNKRKTLGTVIIGIAITLAIAFVPLIIVGQDYITKDLITHSPYAYYNEEREILQDQLTGGSLFTSLLFLGLSIVTMIALKTSKKGTKLFFYPILIGIVLGILIGVFFPSFEHANQRVLELKFNKTLFFIITGLGLFISLISLGVNLRKSTKET